MADITVSGSSGGYDTSATGGAGYYGDFILPGLGSFPVSSEETISQKLIEEYKEWIAIIKEMMNKSGPLTIDDAKRIQEAMTQLAILAKTGDTSTTPPSYMQKEMLEGIKNIFALLNSAGLLAYQPISDPNTVLKLLEDLRQWKTTDPKGNAVTFDTFLEDALTMGSGRDQVLQSQLWSFVQEANRVLESKLDALADQLELSKQIVDLLKRMQDLRNRIVSVTIWTPPWMDNPEPQPPVLADLTQEDVNELFAMKNELDTLLEALKQRGGDTEEAGSLAAALAKVRQGLILLDDYDDNYNIDDFPRAKMVCEAWFMDENTDIKRGGVIQDNINKANTAAVSLNDVQKEELRSVQYIYEQWIKIANELTQLIQKFMTTMAQGIAK
jgi:hypothetical protein